MDNLLKNFFKEERINSILVISVFLFFSIWWAIVYYVLNFKNSTANYVWTSSYHIIAVIGAYIAYFIHFQDSKKQSVLPKNFIFLIALGLTFQAIGQVLYSVYSTWFGMEAPYPSIGDAFFLSGVFSYLVAAVLIYAYIAANKNFKRYLLLSTFIFTILAAIEITLLNNINYKIALSGAVVLDFLYLTFDTLSTSLVISLLLSTNFFKNSQYRLGYIFLCLGIIMQLVADYNFTYWVQQGAWFATSFPDYLYLVSYFFVSLGVVQFTKSFIAINILAVIFNSLLLIQVVVANTVVKRLSDGLLFLVCLAISYLLLKRNKTEVVQRESTVRLAALEESHAKLQELDKQKTEFLNIAAHQLRTPVSIIRNYVSMVQDGDFGPVTHEVKGVLNNIYDSNQWLVRLADEFLDISRLESGQVKYNLTQGDIAKVVREVAGDLAPKAKDKGLEFVVDSPENLVAQFDTEKMRHVILNFIENSIKYTEVGKIVVKVEKAGGNVVFIVSDTGLGFAYDDKDRLFQKFQRGKNAHEIEVNTSTGLGLYICRKFVEGHGGTVFAKSEGLGQGSEFGFNIPISKINN